MADKTFDNTVVNTVDLDQYLGTWYEIARYGHSFERNMEGVKAVYSMRDDGLIKVLNSGYKGSLSGKYKETEGKARVPNQNIPAKIQVAFFLNFWGDYYIMELADDYRYALIGSSTGKYLWILSRTPKHLNIILLYQRVPSELIKNTFSTFVFLYIKFSSVFENFIYLHKIFKYD